MLKKCDNSAVGRVIEYIGKDRGYCFYLYMDLLEAGAEADGLGLWISEEQGDILAVMYRYFDCLHIFCRECCPTEDILPLIRELRPKVISGMQKSVDSLLDSLPEGEYEYEQNYIVTMDRLADENPSFVFVQAQESDIPEIAELMLKDHIYQSVYTYEKLCTDLADRLRQGFGRMFIMRDSDGRLLATNATNAETDDLAVVGGLITDPAMRKKGLGGAITAHTWNLLMREGKQVFSFVLTDNAASIALHKKMGCIFYDEVSTKLIRNA